ncbi:MAG: hypothetical protein K2X66_12015, partial [Cyanobacteria bacterium]|nr:hypothetical protein [Cyanobacteriota bacterium]
GQSLSEYVLPISLVSLLGIVGLSLLGNNLSTLFTNTISTKQNPGMITRNAPSIPQNVGGNNPLTASSNIPFSNLPGKMIQMNLNDGKSLTLNYADPVAVADSAGGNGVTENALAILKQIAQQLREQGEDETKVVALEKLAQYGQKIKEIQKQVEAKFPEGRLEVDIDRFNFLTNPDNNILVDGKEMSLLEASAMLTTFENNDRNIKLDTFDAYSSLFTSNKNNAITYNARMNFNSFNTTYTPTPNQTTSSPLINFMAQLKTVEDTGLLQNTLLKQLVRDDLSFQIFNSSNQTVKVPTKFELSELVQRTRNNANDLCSLAKSVTCKDRG